MVLPTTLLAVPHEEAIMRAVSPFPTLFSPIRIGTMTLENRIVMPPMVSRMGAPDGGVTDCLVDYYEERARGGAGLVIVEFSCTDSSTGRIRPTQLNIDDDRFIPGLRRLAQAIKRHGAKAAIQIGHGGNASSTAAIGRQAIAPSAVTRPGYEPPREMTHDEVQALIARFGEAAIRAREAGFDGVEVHAAHHYLGQQFLSPVWNRRQDEYGGSLENRARFLLEALESVRHAVGRDYPVWCRINAKEEGVEGGTTLEEAALTARMAQNAGSAAISVTAWTVGVGWTVGYAHLPPMARPPGNLLPLVEPIKKAVSIPVMAVGRIDPVLGEMVLRQGKADLICIGRGLIAAPDLPVKAAQGQVEDAVPCIACDTCRDRGLVGLSLGCAVNPAVGKERELRLQPTPHPKRVLVVGGGPAGMQAARIAALMGHHVTIIEKGSQLGGQLLQAAVPPHKEGIPLLLSFLTDQMKRLGVEVVLGKAATPQDILALKPEAVRMATGVRPFVPD
ncbi:MAG: FAD-dependent oxidoreductase, partial [Chloroflexota bacterium]